MAVHIRELKIYQDPFERRGPRPQCKLRPGLSHKITLVCEHDKLVAVESTVKLIKTETELIKVQELPLFVDWLLYGR